MPLRLLLSLAACFTVAAAEIPAGTQISIRLLSKLDTGVAKAKDRFEAVVVSPVVLAGLPVIAPGTKLFGQVRQSTPLAESKEGNALLMLDFQELRDRSGYAAKLSAKLDEVDNARELINDAGAISGIDPKTAYGNMMDSGIRKLSQKLGGGLGDVLANVKSAVVNQVNAEIIYEPGTEMRIELTKPLAWNGTTAGFSINPVRDEERLAAMVNAQPFRTMAEKGERPSDMTNLMFIGTEAQVAQAFEAAGWSRPDPLNERSKLETFRAIVEDRGYKEGPMSTLLLEGAPPALDFQKQNNTFAQRHHLRIWRRPGTFEGKPVWVCAATHDIAIAYSDSDHTFIHKIDPEIDKERAKVVSDLIFTGKVQSLALVGRSGLPVDAHNATGDPLVTDGRMAVVMF